MKSFFSKFTLSLVFLVLLTSDIAAGNYEKSKITDSQKLREKISQNEELPPTRSQKVQDDLQNFGPITKRETGLVISTESGDFVTVKGQSKINVLHAASGEKNSVTFDEKQKRARDPKRGIGGVRPGHAVATIEKAYGTSYSGLIQQYFDILDNVGGEVEVNQQYAAPGIVSPTPEELKVEIDVVREVIQIGGTEYTVQPVADGDILTQNDSYKVMFQCNVQCYMYIAQLDSTGKMDPIFPSSYFSLGNPVNPHIIYSIPPERKWFYLDENTGVETIYFIASRYKRSDLEQLFQRIGKTNKSLVQQNPVSLDSAVVITRGIGGVREGGKQTVNFQDGSKGQYSSTLFSSIQADFVMTRWFHHQ